MAALVGELLCSLFHTGAGRDSPLKHLVCHTIYAAGPHEALTYL